VNYKVLYKESMLDMFQFSEDGKMLS